MSLPDPPAFEPWPLARGGNLQTLMAFGLPVRSPKMVSQPGFERVQVPYRDDGKGGSGVFAEGWFHPGSGEPAVLLLHGLGGSADSGYMRRAARLAADAGHAVLALNHRGSGEIEQTQLPYMAGRSEDIADAMDWLRARAATERILAVGFSLSGNTLLKLAGEGKEQPPELALAICSPVSLEDSSADLLRWPAHAYDWWLLRSCRRWVPELRGLDPHPPQYAVPRFSSMREFDKRYITPVWGFRSREHYYQEASCASWLRQIGSPAVLISAMDDPIVSGARLAAAERSSFLQHIAIPSGGHLGFLARNPIARGPLRWLDDCLEHYLLLAQRGGVLAHWKHSQKDQAQAPYF